MTRTGDKLKECLNDSDFIFEGGSDEDEDSAGLNEMGEKNLQTNMDVPK